FEVVVAQESHHTASATRNRGFAEAKGDWVLFFDSDDTMRPTLVESYRNAITQHGGALDLVATKACLHSLDGNLRNLPFFTTDLFANQILHSIFSTQRYAVRREYFAKFGGWNNDVLQWDDWELGIRLMLGQPRVATISDALVDIYESGEASITGTNFSDRIGRWEQALDEATHQVANSNHPEKKRMLHLIDFRRIVLAAHYAKEGKTEAARELYAPVYRRLAAGSPLRRIILPLLYHITSKGLRGASRLAKCLIRN
ncbi:MAG: glycosyltransferase, partial [Sodaliphilus sp.]|nr:glycosyltransferase [Sodaliphilus sp.]